MAIKYTSFPTGSRLLTVVAYDRDLQGTPNSTFHYEIKSVSPNPPDTEFTINESGTISFKGCLDNEASVSLYNTHCTVNQIIEAFPVLLGLPLIRDCRI